MGEWFLDFSFWLQGYRTVSKNGTLCSLFVIFQCSIFVWFCFCISQLQVPIGGIVGGVVCACATIQHSRASTWLTAGSDIGFFDIFCQIPWLKTHPDMIRSALENGNLFHEDFVKNFSLYRQKIFLVCLSFCL